MNLPEINLLKLHESIAAGFKKQFPDCLIDYYNRPGEKIITPAIFFELENVEPADPSDSGTEQLEVELKFSAEVIVSYKQNGLLGVRFLALSVSSLVQGNRWEEPISPGEFIDAAPEGFSGPMDAYESWRVSWKHTALLGKNIWKEINPLPKQVLSSFVPRIGVPHKSSYLSFEEENYISVSHKKEEQS